MDNALGFLIESFLVGVGPPVGQITGGIKLASLVVETMGHLVADYGSHAAIVEGVVSLCIEERWLHDASRKNYFVDLRVVIGVDSRRRHAPLRLINRLASCNHLSSMQR